MRFIKAYISNFRILRDVCIDFSADPEKKLTVIRAQNESGKTTLLTALQWALYGDKILPDKGKDFRLHPIDWDNSKSPVVSIEVSLEFENYTYSDSGESSRKRVRHYQLERVVEERILNDSWERYNETICLSEKINGKYKQLLNSETALQEMLPPELSEIFFTDGDRALSFIESDVSTQRKKVKNAVKSLLGITIIEAAIVHLKNELKSIERDVQKVSKSSSLSKVCDHIDNIEKEITEIEPLYRKATDRLETIEEEAKEVERIIYDALKKGDKTEIIRKLRFLEKDIKRIQQNIEENEKEHCQIFKLRDLPSALLSPFFLKAKEQVDSVLEEEALPGATITIMKQLLEQQDCCLCGESLDPTSEHGKKRLSHLEKVSEDAIKQGLASRSYADFKYVVSQLYSSSIPAKEKWKNKLQKIHDDMTTYQDSLNDKMEEARELQTKKNSIPDVDISTLTARKKRLNQERDDLRLKQDRLFNNLSQFKNSRYKSEREKKELLKNENLNIKILSDLEATQDILAVFLNSYASIMNTELKNVSDTMNNFFMEMIGATAANDKAIILSSEITSDFNIKVYGPEKRPLNPSKDLNGASRRALTISLILALTTVSGVDAPNIIDTPLGMMSGHVKKFVAERFIQYSSQPVLFLTRDEIAGCEDILDKYMGEITTLSNPAHYPKSLKNHLESKYAQIIACKCNHTQYCAICERVGDQNNTRFGLTTH